MKVRMPMYANSEARKKCQVSSVTFYSALLRQGLSLNPKLTISSPARLVTSKPHQSIFLSPPQTPSAGIIVAHGHVQLCSMGTGDLNKHTPSILTHGAGCFE